MKTTNLFPYLTFMMIALGSSKLRAAVTAGDLPPIANGDGKLLHHIVTFRFPRELTDQENKAVVDGFRNLKKTIPYIVSLESGQNNSPEGVLSQQIGFKNSVVYEVVFKSAAERDYYVMTDPRHGVFKAIVGPLLGDTDEERAKNVIVLDFLADPT